MCIQVFVCFGYLNSYGAFIQTIEHSDMHQQSFNSLEDSSTRTLIYPHIPTHTHPHPNTSSLTALLHCVILMQVITWQVSQLNPLLEPFFFCPYCFLVPHLLLGLLQCVMQRLIIKSQFHETVGTFPKETGKTLTMQTGIAHCTIAIFSRNTFIIPVDNLQH